MNDNRTHPRKASALPVTIKTENGSYNGSISDISPSGAFIEIQEPFEIGCILVLHLENLSMDEPFLLKGQVTSHRADGIGIKFEGLSEQQQNILSFLYW